MGPEGDPQVLGGVGGCQSRPGEESALTANAGTLCLQNLSEETASYTHFRGWSAVEKNIVAR